MKTSKEIADSNRRMHDPENFKRLDELKSEQPRRTQYAIRHTTLKMFVGEHFQWVELKHAKRFEFMVMATAHAYMEMGLETNAFTVEAV